MIPALDIVRLGVTSTYGLTAEFPAPPFEGAHQPLASHPDPTLTDLPVNPHAKLEEVAWGHAAAQHAALSPCGNPCRGRRTRKPGVEDGEAKQDTASSWGLFEPLLVHLCFFALLTALAPRAHAVDAALHPKQSAAKAATASKPKKKPKEASIAVPSRPHQPPPWALLALLLLILLCAEAGAKPLCIGGCRSVSVGCEALQSSLVMDGALYAFGENGNGQVGLGDTTDRLSPTAVLTVSTNMAQTFAAGYEHLLVTQQWVCDGLWIQRRWAVGPCGLQRSLCADAHTRHSQRHGSHCWV